MKRYKRRLWLILFMVAFILYVSYKILEPELVGHNFKSLENEEIQQLQIKHQIEDENNFREHSHRKMSDDVISTDHIISRLKKKYRLDFTHPLKESPWTIAKNWVTLRNIHPAHTPEMGAILKAMATRRITKADVGYKGTQIKMTVVLEGGQKAVFKPKLYSRSFVIEGSPYGGVDRHNGEITSFHLGRLLEFRRTPLVVGRVVDMETEIEPVAEKSLKDTFFKRNNSSCFYGKCLYCKGPETGVCGDGTRLEGAMILWLPETMTLSRYRNPWRRSYRNNTLQKWEKDDKFCQTDILPHELFKTGPRLMDIIDAAILDYLVGNADRHMYETITNDRKAMMILMDNGKSVGNPYHDERSILGPLYQCCRVREKTWSRLLILQDGVLSTVLRDLLAQDPITPVLTDLHFQAFDRRLKHILTGIKACIAKYGVETVFIKDR